MTIQFGSRTRLGSPISLWGKNPYEVTGFFPSQSEMATVSVQADATPHVKGAWTELFASSVNETNFVVLDVINSAGSTATEGLLDIGIGAAGSETVVIPNAVGGEISADSSTKSTYIFPLNIPKGSRIAARLQNVTASRTASVNISLLQADLRSPSSIDALGVTTASSRGTNVLTTYTEIVASTSVPYQGIIVAAMNAGTATASETITFTTAIGAASSEIDIATNVFTSNAAEFVGRSIRSSNFICYRHIAAGSRLSVKTSVGRSYRDVILYGIPYP